MKTLVVKHTGAVGRAVALKFVRGGKPRDHRVAFLVSGGHAFRFERLSNGQPMWGDADHLWFGVNRTVRQVLGMV